VKQRRLPAPGPPEHGDHLIGVDREADTVEHEAGGATDADALDEPLGMQHRHESTVLTYAGPHAPPGFVARGGRTPGPLGLRAQPAAGGAALPRRGLGPRGPQLSGRRDGRRRGEPPGYDSSVPDRLYFTDSEEANELIASDPMALLIGFALDQQVPVQKAFSGPLVIRERVGSLDPAALAAADLDAAFRQRPAVHRFPGAMAKRVHELAVHIRDGYGGDAARVWTGAADAEQLRANLAALPGFGEMKIKALGAVLAKRFGVEAANGLVPWHPTLGDVDSPQALVDYQAAKRAHKAQWAAAQPV
jgi:uncharacterized HhH-GPD family protein